MSSGRPQAAPSVYTVQRLDPHGWANLAIVPTWTQVIETIGEHGGNIDNDGSELPPEMPGWIVAESPTLRVHSRKDGRWRVLEEPAASTSVTEGKE